MTQSVAAGRSGTLPRATLGETIGVVVDVVLPTVAGSAGVGPAHWTGPTDHGTFGKLPPRPANPHLTVDNLANRYQSDLSHPRRVADLSLQVFDALAEAGLYEPDGSDRELLWAACMLHDIGTVIDYDDHHKHSRYLILNGGLPGFTPREVELIALVARYHRKGTPDVGEMGGFARKGDDVRLSVLAGTVRLAEQLERSRDGSVRAVHVHAENGSVTVRPEASGEASTVAIWSARRNAELLESAIHRRLEIVEP